MRRNQPEDSHFLLLVGTLNMQVALGMCAAVGKEVRKCPPVPKLRPPSLPHRHVPVHIPFSSVHVGSSLIFARTICPVSPPTTTTTTPPPSYLAVCTFPSPASMLGPP